MTFTSYHAHTAPIFRDLEILTIDKLIVHRIGIVMYKFNYGFLPEVLNTMYRKIVKFILIILEVRTCFEFSNISARIWNSLVVIINNLYLKSNIQSI